MDSIVGYKLDLLLLYVGIISVSRIRSTMFNFQILLANVLPLLEFQKTFCPCIVTLAVH